MFAWPQRTEARTPVEVADPREVALRNSDRRRGVAVAPPGESRLDCPLPFRVGDVLEQAPPVAEDGHGRAGRAGRPERQGAAALRRVCAELLRVSLNRRLVQ